MNLRNIETRLNRIKTPERYKILKPYFEYEKQGMSLDQYDSMIAEFWKNTGPEEKVYRIQ